MRLEVGQHYEAISAIAQGYESLVGAPFRFAFRISSLDKRQPTPTDAVVGDVYCKLVNWGPRKPGEFNKDLRFICDCLCIGHDKYFDRSFNYSPNDLKLVVLPYARDNV